METFIYPTWKTVVFSFTRNTPTAAGEEAHENQIKGPDELAKGGDVAHEVLNDKRGEGNWKIVNFLFYNVMWEIKADDNPEYAVWPQLYKTNQQQKNMQGKKREKIRC